MTSVGTSNGSGEEGAEIPDGRSHTSSWRVAWLWLAPPARISQYY